MPMYVLFYSILSKLYFTLAFVLSQTILLYSFILFRKKILSSTGSNKYIIYEESNETNLIL